jgi:hypothetical protein
MKVGAFTPCLKCGFTPDSKQDQARSMLLSSHNLDSASLEEKSHHIKAGGIVTFDESMVEQMATEFRELMGRPAPGARGLLIFKWSLVGIMLVLAGAVAWFYWYLKYAS